MQYLDAAGLINVLSGQLWDSSPWLPQDGIVGRILHALIGYTDRPTELQLITYLAILAVMAALNVAHELLTMRLGGGFDLGHAKRRISAIESQIDAAIAKQEKLF